MALDQENTSGALGIGFGENAGVKYRSQSFIPTLNLLEQIAVHPNSTGSKGLKFYIDNADSNGFPTGTLGVGLYSFVVPNASLVAALTAYSLPVPLSVTPGNSYCYYMAPWDTAGDVYSDDYRDFRASVSNPYASGKMASYETATGWYNNDDGNADMVFQTYGSDVPLVNLKDKFGFFF